VFIVRKIQDKYALPPTPGEFQAGATLPISGDFKLWVLVVLHALGNAH